MKCVLASMLVAGLMVGGCDKKDTSKDVEKAADKTGSAASDALSKVKGNVAEGAKQANDAAKQGADSTKQGMDVLQKNIDDLISKAKAAVNDKKWDDADNYIKQIKDLETKLPQPAQDKINASLADVQKLIDSGRSLTPGK